RDAHVSPEETAARVRDLVARHKLCQRELASCRRENDRLRAVVDNRPTQAQYKTLAARCADLERQLEQRTRMHQSAAQHNRDLRKTLERVRGGPPPLRPELPEV